MDVEKRMNLSLDEIIKSKNPKGRRNASASQAPKARTQAQGRTLRKGKPVGKSVALGIKRSGVKKAGVVKAGVSKARKPAIPKRQSLSGGKGKNVNARVNSALPSGNQNRGYKGQRLNNKQAPRNRQKGQRQVEKRVNRTVDLPKLSNLRITIENDRAIQQPTYIAQPQYPVNYASTQPGYGPRNTLAREEPSVRIRPNAQAPIRRQASNDFGLSRRVLGPPVQHQQPQVRRPPFVDYDNPSANQSYMRMDTH